MKLHEKTLAAGMATMDLQGSSGIEKDNQGNENSMGDHICVAPP